MEEDRRRDNLGKLLVLLDDCQKQIKEIEDTKNGKIIHAIKLNRLKRKEQYLKDLISDERAILDIDDPDKQNVKIAL